jgi:hypothetical protein
MVRKLIIATVIKAVVFAPLLLLGWGNVLTSIRSFL